MMLFLWEREECQIQETTSVDDITLDEIWDFVQEVPGEQYPFSNGLLI